MKSEKVGSRKKKEIRKIRNCKMQKIRIKGGNCKKKQEKVDNPKKLKV